MKLKDVNEVVVPKYEEFNSRKVWEKVRNKPTVSCYFKDFGDKGCPDRTYLFNVNP